MISTCFQNSECCFFLPLVKAVDRLTDLRCNMKGQLPVIVASTPVSHQTALAGWKLGETQNKYESVPCQQYNFKSETLKLTVENRSCENCPKEFRGDFFWMHEEQARDLQTLKVRQQKWFTPPLLILTFIKK